VDEIVEGLINRVGLRPSVARTTGLFTVTCGSHTVGRFIRDILLPLASREGLQEDWIYWVEAGETFHFKPLIQLVREQGPSLQFHNWKFVFDDISVSLEGVKVTKSVIDEPLTGAAGVISDIFDPITGRYYRWYEGWHNTGMSTLGEKPISRPRAAAGVHTTTRSMNRNMDSRSTFLQVKEEAGSIFRRSARGLYRMKMRSPYIPHIKVGRAGTFYFNRGNQPPDWLQGKWIVEKVKYVCTQQSLRTWITLMKCWE